MAATISVDRAFFQALCAPAAAVHRPQPPLDLSRMGAKMLDTFVHHDVAALAGHTEGQRAILRKLWALPQEEQARLLEAANIFGYMADPDLEGPTPALRFQPDHNAGQLFPPEFSPLQACRHQECRQTREVSSPIWSVHWAKSGRKPAVIFPWKASGIGAPARICSGNEKGMLYYCSRRFEEGHTFSRAQASTPSVADLCARLPLLLTLSQHFIPYWRLVHEVPDELVAGKHKVDDGRAEVGISVAADISMLETAIDIPHRGITLYDIGQHRSVLITQKEWVVTKGLVVINERLDPKEFRVPSSCVKLRFQPDQNVPWPAQPGLDIVQTSANRDLPPRLNSQVIAALLLRLCLMPSGPERDAQERKLEEWPKRLHEYTAKNIANVAWGLPSEAECPPGVHVDKLLPSEPPQVGPQVDWATLRVPREDITFQYLEQCPDPTPLDTLQARLPEDKPWTMSRGSPAGFEHGGRRYLQGVDNYLAHPRLVLPTIGVTAFAVPDPWDELEHGQCYIISGGRVLTGKFAVWRDPIMCAADVQTTRLQCLKTCSEASDVSRAAPVFK